jgi:Ca2+-transporting ATPase
MDDNFDNHFRSIVNLQGLSKTEVKERLQRYGLNELPRYKKFQIFDILKEIFTEPMFLILLLLSAIYFVIGDPHEAIMLSTFVAIIITITIYQQTKTEKTLEMLKNLSSPRALVMRDGKIVRIPAQEIVVDDIIFLSAGDRIPADAKLIFSNNLMVDESLLTGESFPQEKRASYKEDAKSTVYSGTLVVKGNGVAKVIATGLETEIGKIGKSLAIIKPERTYVEKEIRRIVRLLATLGIIICITLTIIYGLNFHNWLEGIITGITLAMAIIPEELPVILTVFFVVGAWRIAQKKVLTRRIPALEMLGAATVLCVDKTGTITLNEMRVKKIITANHIYEKTAPQLLEFSEAVNIIKTGILASEIHPTDPVEKAINHLARRVFSNISDIYNSLTLLSDYPLQDNLLAMARVWKSTINQTIIIAAKGAPEAIAELCHLSPDILIKLNSLIKTLATEGLKVIGVARATFAHTFLPSSVHDFNFEFLGLLGLEDPIRPEVKMALKECQEAGIKVMMITGDYPETAQKIAHGINLEYKVLVNGDTLRNLDNESLKRLIKEPMIFARIRPNEKLRIINVLKSNNEVVAMTGDGVNDAPALKAAHIGIALGKSGSDVAREAASLVLLDDNFASIVAAIRTGRRIFDNLRKAITYVWAVHFPILGLAIIPTLLKLPRALFPPHILFLELIIDPASSIIFEMENEEIGIMNRPPRKITEPLINLQMFSRSLIQGGALLLTAILIYFGAPKLGFTTETTRGITFINLVLGNIALIFTNRNPRGKIFSCFKEINRGIVILIITVILVLPLIFKIPVVRNIFKFGEINILGTLIAVGATIIVMILYELIKFISLGK